MLIRSLALAAVLLAPSAALAQETPDLKARVAAFIQPTNAERTQVVIDKLLAAGFEPSIEPFEGGNDRTGPMAGQNVVVAFGGDGEEDQREILLTAHYDAVKLRDGSMSQGVVDNAACVVAMIEAAKALRDEGTRHRIRLILLDQEELGLIGARRWVEAHGLANVAAVVNSDVAAYGDTMMYGLNNGEQSAPVTRAVREVCAERALNCVGYPVYPPSDDRVFSGAGLGDGAAASAVAPTVSLGFQDHVGAHQMWLAFNGGEDNGLAEGFVPRVFRLIHSAEDTMEHVDPATIALAAETYAAVVRKLDASLAGVD